MKKSEMLKTRRENWKLQSKNISQKGVSSFQTLRQLFLSFSLKHTFSLSVNCCFYELSANKFDDLSYLMDESKKWEKL